MKDNIAGALTEDTVFNTVSIRGTLVIPKQDGYILTFTVLRATVGHKSS